MTELVIVVEGQTEEIFVKETLAPHLAAFEVWARPTVVTTSFNQRTGAKTKGGGGWKCWKSDLMNLLRRKDSQIRVSTMIDLYGMPSDFPNRTTLLHS